MKRISYAGSTVLTGDDIADAVVQYAAALAREEKSAAIDIPAVSEDGRLITANLLIGPASQLVVIPEDTSFDEIIDDKIVASFTAETRKLAGPLPRASEPDDDAGSLLTDIEYPGSGTGQ
ncbi:MAG: hypothetical protein JWO10_1849 [Microbacteriaceae bacterium]|nr:hypothetical protein [Microbacteriaceae bacterium]